MDGNFSPRIDYTGLGDADVQHMRDRYDAEVRWADEDVARLLDALAAAGHADDTLLVISSDHGEAFAEHGTYFSHGTVYQESIRVPLLLHGPGVPRGARVAEAVGLIDLVPTLLRIVDPDAPETTCDGRDLADTWAKTGLPGRRYWRGSTAR